MALEHVAHGQARFMTPGVAPDPRGIVLGRYLLLVFPTLEGVVSWLRLYSHESSLDELVVTDTIPLSDAAKACGRIRQLSVAELLAETIRRIAFGESVSSLYVD